MDPKIEEKFKEASEDSSILQDQTKTKIQITINGEDVFLMKIQKHSTNFTLADVKNQTIVNGKVGLEEIDEDDTILKLLGSNIEMECWSK